MSIMSYVTVATPRPLVAHRDMSTPVLALAIPLAISVRLAAGPGGGLVTRETI